MGLDRGGDPDRRREKNRIAQRRFRERQKTTVAVLQSELDAKEAEMQKVLSHLRVLDQTNKVRECVLGVGRLREEGPLAPPPLVG